MGKQEDIFAEGEGDAWFSRNFWALEDKTEIPDPVIEAIKQHVQNKKLNHRFIELGCSNGARLEAIQKIWSYAYCVGIDPSASAIANGAARYQNINLHRGTMVANPISREWARVLIYGFCLYVCDPEELFEIAVQGDRLLEDGGYLIIHDFDPEFPHSVPNKHVDGLMTYKMDWSKLWLSNPAYRLIAKNVIPDGTAVWVLQKKQSEAFPCLSEYSDLAPSGQDTPET